MDGDNMNKAYQPTEAPKSEFYKEIVDKTRLANDPNFLRKELYDKIKIRIVDAAEEGLDCCYVEPCWKYDGKCLDDCIQDFVSEGFVATLNCNSGGYIISWEGGTDAYEKETAKVGLR